MTLSSGLASSILESAPDAMVVINASGTILFVNHPVTALFGYDSDAHAAADRANRSRGRFLATASHDLRQPLQALSLLNGSYVQSRPVLLWKVRTAPARRRTDTAPRMPSVQLKTVLDAAVDAVFVIDHHGQILFANRASERLFGWSATELRGRDVNMLMSEPDRSAHPACLARFRATGAARIIGKGRDVQAQRRDGCCFPARLSVGEVEGSDPPEFVGFIHDLSDRVQEAEDARRLNDRLMQVTRMATMGEMATGIAHEVNQPLTAITNYALAASRFLAAPDPELGDVREALQEIAAEAQRAGEIIRRMRRMARGNDGGEREETRPEELLEELRLLCVADARANDTRLRFDVQPDLPRLMIHRVQIAQALLNLVRNALESVAGNPPGEREVIVQARATPAGDCEFAVCDNGAGVMREVAARLFEPFLSTKRQGTGLGLPMSQTIAQAHGGSVRHEPCPPRGARFVLTLPAAEAAS